MKCVKYLLFVFNFIFWVSARLLRRCSAYNIMSAAAASAAVGAAGCCTPHISITSARPRICGDASVFFLLL